MKLLIFLLFPCVINAQISGQMRVGYNTIYKNLIISPAVDFGLHGFHFTPEMIANPSNDKPVSFGLKLSYEFKVNESVSIQAGLGKCYDLYSTDAYDKYRNEWNGIYFTALHWNNWFVQYDYLKGGILSIGFRESLSNF